MSLREIELQASLDRRDERITELEKKIDLLRSAVSSVRSLMDHSDGVAGLHLNGDIATWDSLGEGWLLEFSEYIEAVE